MTKDIGLHESGSGGDLTITANDLLIGESLFQQVYLALFGGNLEASTRGDELFSEERFDWWGNSLFLKDDPSKQFNSITEKTITEVALNSQGRLKIISAINNDLDYLKSFLKIDIDVSFLGATKIQITIIFSKKEGNDSKVLQLVYDNAKNELITQKTI